MSGPAESAVERRTPEERPAPAAGGAPRLFAALPLPEEVRERLSLLAGRLAAAFPEGRLRPVAIENLHLTLRFYGSAPNEVPNDASNETPRENAEDRAAEILERHLRSGVHRVAETLRERGAAPPRLSLPSLAPSPSDHRPRLVWAEAVEGPASAGFLVALRRTAEAAAPAAGFAPLRRRFTPHVTLARLRRPVPIPSGALSSFLPAEGLWSTPFPIPQVELIASVLDPGGAIYRRLAAFPLE